MTEIVCGAKGVTPTALDAFFQETARVVATAPKHWAKPVLAIQLDGCMTVSIEVGGTRHTHQPEETQHISGGDGLYGGGTVEAMHLVANSTAVRLFNDICAAGDLEALSEKHQMWPAFPYVFPPPARARAVADRKARLGARKSAMPKTHSKTKKA